jgi:hypothetical protein
MDAYQRQYQDPVTYGCISEESSRSYYLWMHIRGKFKILLLMDAYQRQVQDPLLKDAYQRKVVRQIEIQTAEPLVPDPSPFEAEIAIARLKRFKSPGSDQIPAEAGGEILSSKIHKGKR